MKLKEYIIFLTDVVKDNPEAMNLDVIYSRDDEGNGYSKVNYKPSLGIYDSKSDDMENFTASSKKANSICLN